MTDTDWHDQIDVNLSGRANAVRVFAPILVERGGGRFILTSSTQGQHGTKNGAACSASKWGLLGLMKSAAPELGAPGITVNAVIPGLIDTALTRHEDRYAQAVSESGGRPSGDTAEDERSAVAALTAKTPWRSPGSHRRTSRPSSSSWPRTPPGWSAASRSRSPVGTAPTAPPSFRLRCQECPPGRRDRAGRRRRPARVAARWSVRRWGLVGRLIRRRRAAGFLVRRGRPQGGRQARLRRRAA
jgi:hypothetical protein